MSSKDSSKAPWVLQQWAWLYRAVPKVHFPFTDLDISITILSALYLYAIKLVGERILESFGWPPNSPVTMEASASIAGIVHSTTLVPGLIAALYSQPYVPSAKMGDAPQWWQDAVTALLQFCTGYMLYDGLVNIVILRWEVGMSASDWMFLGHHFATSFYMTSARILGAGHESALMCMLLGEATNPLHNSHMISELAQTLHFEANPLTHWIEVMFSAIYVVFRVVLGPLGMIHITYDLVVTKRGRENIPLALKLAWLLMIWGVVFGSIPWIQDCITVLKKHYTAGNVDEL